MATRIQLRRDTAAAWAESNPTLALGEAGFDSTNNQIRIGDGERNWSALTPLDGSNIDLSVYATKSSLSSESSTRANADAALQQQIDNLGEVDLSGYATTADLQAEADARTQADTSLQTQLNQGLTLINGLDERVTALEAGGPGPGPGPGPDPDVDFVFNFRGSTWWPNVSNGELWTNNNNNQLFLSAVDTDGDDVASYLDANVAAGTLLTFMDSADASRWVQYIATGTPVVQNGYRNVPVRQEAAMGVIQGGTSVALIIDTSGNMTAGFAGFQIDGDDREVVTALEALQRQISALKGEITKLRKAQT